MKNLFCYSNRPILSICSHSYSNRSKEFVNGFIIDNNIYELSYKKHTLFDHCLYYNKIGIDINIVKSLKYLSYSVNKLKDICIYESKFKRNI